MTRVQYLYDQYHAYFPQPDEGGIGSEGWVEVPEETKERWFRAVKLFEEMIEELEAVIEEQTEKRSWGLI